MAQADGAVRIDTSLNNNDFNKGVDRMVKAMQNLSATTEKLGKTIDNAFNGYVRTLQNAGAAMRPIEADTSGIADKTEQLSGATDKAAESYGKVAQEAGKAKGAAEEASQKYNEAAQSLTRYQEEAAKAVQSLPDKINMGDIERQSEIFRRETGKISNSVRDIGAEAQTVKSRIEGLSETNSAESFDEAKKAVEELQAKAAGLEKNVQSVAETKIGPAGYEEFVGKLQEAETRLESLIQEQNQLSDWYGLERGVTPEELPAEMPDFAAESYRRLGEEITQTQGRISDLQAAIQTYEDSDASFTISETGYFRELSEEAAKLQTEISGIVESFGAMSGSKTAEPVDISEWESQIEAAEAELDRFRSKVDKMSAIGAADKAWDSIHYDISLAADEAARLQKELDKLSENGGIDETQYDELSQQLGKISDGYADLAGQTDINSEPVQTFGGRLASVAQTAREAGAALLKMASASIINGFKLIGESAAEAARQIAKMTATAVSGGIKRLGAWLSSTAKSMTLFGRSAKRNNNVLEKSFSTILKYGLGVRSFYFLFRKIRQAIGEGYQNLARYSDTLNTSISGVISSFKRFENQFAASFEPLVNTIAPALTNLINSLTEGTYRVGEFIATLSGQKTVIRAKEVQEDYAASLKETKKAAKDAKNQLAGFDKLEILKEKDEHTDPNDMFETVPVEDEAKDFADAVKEAWVNVDLSGIGDMIGGKLKIALDKIPWPDIKKAASDIGKRLASFLNGLINVPGLGKSLGKSIAEAINTAFAFLDGFVWRFDWKGLGNAIMDTVEAACDNLDWELINHALQGLALGLADLLNTIFSRKEVWEKVGRTIGKAINAAVNAGITFLERFDFKQAAIAITAGLNAMIDEIEWDKIGRLLADALGGALQFLRTAALEFHWVELGESFAEGLNEFVRVMLDKILHFEWAQIGQGIADGVNAAVSGIGWNSFGTLVGRLIGGALTIAASFIRGLDYEEIKKSIEEFLTSALRRIDFYDLLTVWGVATLIVAVKKIIARHPVLSLLTGAVLALGPELGNAIHKMVTDIPWEEVGANFAGAFNGIISRIDEAITSVDWAAETATIMTGLNSFLAGIDWASLGQTLTDAVIAFLAVINTALHDFDWKGLGADIAVLIQNIDVVEILKGAARLASSFVTGLLDLINGFLETADWTELPGTILNGFLGVVTSVEWGRIAGQIIELLLNAILVVIQLAWGIGEAIAEWILNGIEAAKNYFQTAGENVANGILEGLGKIWEGIKGWIKEHIFQPFISAWEHIWRIGSPSKVMEEQGGFIIDGLLGGITAAWHTITDFFGGALDGLKATLGGAWDAISGAASDAWNGISTTLGGIVSGIASTIGDTWESVKTATGEKWNEVTSALGKTWESVKTAAGDKFKAVKETVSGAWDNIKTNASKSLGEVSKTVSGKWSAMKADASKAWDGLKTSVGQTLSGVKSESSSKIAEIVNDAKTKWERVKADASNAWNGVKSSIVPKAQEIRSQVASAFTSLQGTLSGVWGSIRSAASGALSSVSATVGSMVSSISSKVSSIQSTVRNVTSATSDALAKTASKMDELAKKNASAAVKVGGLASGGFVLDGGKIHKYASGTARAAGSLFVAGESGPEIVGHVNGRTEVLNQSQIASAIYSAVLSAMGEAAKTLGGFLSQQMAANTNALITAIGQIQAPQQIAAPQDTTLTERLAALQAVPYQVPAYATGTVMPYEVVAEIRRQTSELKTAIYDEGEEIIQAIVSAISNHGLSITNAISRIPVNQGQSYTPDDIGRSSVDYINRQTRMNGRSPLLS